MWAPPRGQGRLGQGQWASVGGGGARCLIPEFAGSCGTLAPQGVSLRLPALYLVHSPTFPRGLWESRAWPSD